MRQLEAASAQATQDGVFVGRASHDVAALSALIDEAAALAARRGPSGGSERPPPP